MMSKVESAAIDGMKLPSVVIGPSCLVSQTSSIKATTITPKDVAANWAVEIRRRINEYIECHENLSEDDIMALERELIGTFISTLQQDSHFQWSVLVEILTLIEPYQEYFTSKAEICHYIERILHHLHFHRERLFDLQIEYSLTKAFPEYVREIKVKGPVLIKNYSKPASAQSTRSHNTTRQCFNHPAIEPHQYLGKHLPDGTDPYRKCIPPKEMLIRNKQLTLRDLSKSMSSVALEMASRETAWSYPLGTTALALATILPDKECKENENEYEDSTANETLQTVPLMSRFGKTPHAVPEMHEEVPIMNGREAVQFFAGCHHLGKIKSLYLNLAPNRHYNPYDLISVPKNKANPEHYVFSTFGVLHVYPDLSSESLSLAEWQKEAVLWSAMSKIPFFRNYLKAKAFHRWSANIKYTEFQRLQRKISINLLPASPLFGAALLQITRLLKELLIIPFLPMDTNRMYQLGEFENCVNYKNIQADKFLERFFKYYKLVLDFAMEGAIKKLHHCEAQVKKKTLFSKDSMYLQRKKKKERERNLNNAKREAAFLGNFVKLVDYMVVEHMFEITKTQGINFIHTVLEVGVNAPREGFFMASLAFNKYDALCLSPSKKCFKEALYSALHGIPSVLLSKAISIDSQVPKNDLNYSNTTQISSNCNHVKVETNPLSQEHHTHCQVLENYSQQEKKLLADHKTSSSGISENDLILPNLPKQKIPTKEEDNLGVATPDLVIMHASDYTLQVEGEGFIGHYSPLSKANLEEKLLMDQDYQTALKKQADLLSAAFEEIDTFCKIHAWLNDVHKFCQLWTESSVQQFRGVASFTIEQKLSELCQWSDKVRHFDSNYTTENGIFFIDCSTVHKALLSKLDIIYQEILTFVANEAYSLAKGFEDEMNTILKNLLDKRPDISSFAVFAKNFGDYKKNTIQFQQKMEHIKSLFEVMRMSNRQLVPEEEKTEERILSLWESFLIGMQDAAEFVSTETPLMTQQLDEKMQHLCKEAYLQAKLATTGQFLQPSENPFKILTDMKAIQEKYIHAQRQLQEASQWKEAITGESFNLNFLNELTLTIDVRLELWKYVEASTSTIKDWKKMLFKKINVTKALEKVREWQLAASQFKSLLPPEDQVLTAWLEQLQEFSKDLPLLHKLAHNALRERHWHSIFLGMNESYDPNHQFTVAELTSYNLSNHADLINTTHKSAVAEYDLEQSFNHIINFWQDRPFKLAKHIPDSLFNKSKELVKRTLSSNKRLRKLERLLQERAAAVAQHAEQKCLDVTTDDFFILIEVEELKYQLEDSRISVDAMLASPYVEGIRDQVVFWCQALREIEEIANLWIECQNKWLYLLKIFERADLYSKLPQQAGKFEEVHNKFKDWMRVVANDSRCLSVVSRKRGERGYRLLQGDNLISLFLHNIKEQEEILKNLETFFERARADFPRLYFLSNLEIVDLLGVSRNLPALVPFVRKCFHNVQNLTFALPTDLSGLSSHLDHTINSDKLDILSIQGACGEEVPLYTRVEANSSATKWMYDLNEVFKNTMTLALRDCVQARMEEGSKQPILILDELAMFDRNITGQEQGNNEARSTFQHWLLRSPVQCVLTAEAIMWERGMTVVLEKEDKKELTVLRSSLCAKLDSLVDVLEMIQTRSQISSCDRQRLEFLICSLLNQCIYHRDVMDKLMQSNQITDSAFDWLKILKFHMEIKNILRAKTVVTENNSTSTTSKATKRSSVSKSEKYCKVPVVTQEAPKLTRTHTTVTTDYQFSTCYVQQLNNVFTYDYEYLGPSSHLVITPLTERAFLAMGQALKTFSCSTLIGPIGTGKSETIKELARMLGRCIFTISCHESITFSLMLQYLTGMVQSGCWVLFDDTHRLTKGLLSVAGQQLDYLRTALRALDASSKNQYQIRGHSHFDKVFAMKSGVGDTVIRRNSLTTLHPLSKVDVKISPPLERQRTVPHGFNEEGLVTYFEDIWVTERDQRRHSIEKEIEIKESDLYKSNKPPSLFYEHVKANRKRSPPDYSNLNSELLYVHKMLGNIMLNGKLIQASSNFGCFMTLNENNSGSADIPCNFRVLMRPCALIVPDIECIISITLQCYGYKEHKLWTKKLCFFFKYLETQMPKQQQHKYYLRDVKRVLILAAGQRFYWKYQHQIAQAESDDDQLKSSYTKQEEEQSLVLALKENFIPQYGKLNDETNFLQILHNVFPQATDQHAKCESTSINHQITKVIKEVFVEDHLEYNSVMLDKILQLHTALETQTPVILVGPSGSGKTKVHHILAKVMNILNYKLSASDHSNDNLDADRNVQIQIPKKLKLLKEMDENLKQKQSKEIQILQKQPDEIQILQNQSDEIQTQQKIKLDISLTKTMLSAHGMREKSSEDLAEYPKIDVVHLFPCAMTLSELLGTFEDGMWHGGLLGKIIRDSYFMSLATKTCLKNHSHKTQKGKITKELPSVLKRWLILDGDLDPSWTDGVKTLLDDERQLSLGNGESVFLTDATSVIFETCYLKSVSPSIISRCSVVHCGTSTTTWSALYFTWKQSACSKWLLSADGMKILDDMVSDIFPTSVKFLTSECQTALLTDIDDATVAANSVIPGMTEVTTFLHIISAMFDRFLSRENMKNTTHFKEADAKKEDKSESISRQANSNSTNSSQAETSTLNYSETVKGIFAFTYIWAFGGHLHDRFKEKFSKFALEALYQARHSVCMPQSGLVYDYYLDGSTANFVEWSDHLKGLTGFYVTPEFDRYLYLFELLKASHQPVLLTGAPGVGKTSLVQRMVLSKMSSTTVTMSGRLTPSILQKLLVSQVLDTQNKSNTTGGTYITNNKYSRKKHLFFIDDLSMAPAVGGYCPNLELLRTVLTVGGIYNQDRKSFQKLEEATFIAATTLPSVPGSGLGYASHVISSRLTRQFINLTMFAPSADVIANLYSRPLQAWLDEFSNNTVVHHYEFAKAMSQALIEMYQLVKEKLRPCPAQAHYIFSLHDVSRVIQGIMLMSPRTSFKKVTAMEKVEQSSPASMMNIIVQLWCHEVTRCFGDRIISNKDQAWFNQILQDLVSNYFCSSHDDSKFKDYSQKSSQSQEINAREKDRAQHSCFDSKESDTEISRLSSPVATSSSQARSREKKQKLTISASTVDLRDSQDLKLSRFSSSDPGFTLKTAQITNSKQESQYEPPKSFCNNKIKTLNIKDIIFSKFYMNYTVENQELQAEKGYTLQTEKTLSRTLYRCLSEYNKETSQRLNLVFFSEAVHHAARLSRVLACPRGHALLLSMSCSTGKATLVRLASFVAQYKLFEPEPHFSPLPKLNIVRRYIKLSSYHAGVNGKPTVLLVHEDFGEECLQDICALMAEGTAPGIYSEEELKEITSRMMPGGVQTKRVDKIKQAFERFVKRVQQNLHVLVCLNYKGNSFSTGIYDFHHMLQKYPSLLKNSFSVDFYMPWSLKALSKIAKAWLKDTCPGVVVPWNSQRVAEQVKMASNGMAYIHLSASAAVERQFFNSQESLRIFTPLTFLEFIQLFKVISAFLVQTEKTKAVKFEKLLEKIDEAFGSIAEYRRKVSDLMPQSNAAGGMLNDLMTQVETLKENYKLILNKCKSQENKIIRLQEPLEKLRKTTQTEFDKVNPTYQAAVKVLDNLDLSAVEELRTYSSPPEGVKFVMKAVCLLLGKPQTWEDAKSLMVDTNFFQELIFFKKDNIPDEVFAELKTFVCNPLFTPENVAQASVAASSVCAWVHAVFAYSCIHQKMKPHMKRLSDAEHNLTKAHARLGQLRMEANQMKTNLEQYINQHQEAMKVAKAIEKQIFAIERKIANASHLMENMSTQHFLWRSELKRARKKINSAPGDALITSAALVYHGPFDDRSRQDLLHDWLDHIKQNAFDDLKFMDQELQAMSLPLELHIKANSHKGDKQKSKNNVTEGLSNHGAEIYNELSSNLGLHIQVKTFKFRSAFYDCSSYYKSELKRQDTMQTAVPEDFMDDSDDDENCCLPTRPNLALQEILSDFDELSEWRMQNLPTDLHSIQNALIMRVCCHNRKRCWPLLIDPDNQAEIWIKALQNNQNFFTENDVASFVLDDTIPLGVTDAHTDKHDVRPLSFKNSTQLTFSDANEFTFKDSPSLNTLTFKDPTRRDSEPHYTDKREQLQAVTCVTNNSNNVNSVLDISATSFMTLMADDPHVNSKLISAIVHGATVLVTHMERKLNPLFRDLLLKQFYVDKKGNMTVKVGDFAITYNPDFCLYLSTSVPLFVKGDGIYQLPLNHFCVINMTMSDEAISNRLMFETMKIEKKEFEGQRRSHENDIILHRQRLAKEHEIIREKTENFPGPLLDDTTMLDSLKACQANVEHNRQILEETRYMGDHLEDKFSHYIPFIQHSAMLYSVLLKMSVSYPIYYLPFYKFVELFSAVIRSRDRGKGNIGAPQVRAQEISDAVLQAIFSYAKIIMSEQHYNLLSLLVTIERLLRQHKASNKEVSLFVNAFLKHGRIKDSLLEPKPHWMDTETWSNCNILETLHQPFRGLHHSLINYSQQWEEYFLNHVNLVSQVPGTTLQELSFFQKCLLWKLICPHKMAELSQAMILYELGSAVSPPDNYNVYEIYKLTDKYTPTVFILPDSKKSRALDGAIGIPFVCPATEIKQLAREIGMEGKVRILNFGNASQMLEVKNALKECLRLGHWLLLQNFHLSKEPDPELFFMLKDIIYARWHDNESKTATSETYNVGRSLVTRPSSPTCLNTNNIHQSFRLWITTAVNEERLLPGLLIQHGLRVTCEITANFKSLLGRTYKSAAFLINSNAANADEMTEKFNKVMPFALAHALMLQQCYYGRNAFVHHHFWTLTDLATVVDVFQNLTGWTTDSWAIKDLAAWIYARHCQDLCNANSVQAILDDLVHYALFANQVEEILSRPVKGIGLLLQRLINRYRETKDLQKTLDSIENCSARTISLPDEAQENLEDCKSKTLMTELTHVAGAPELLLNAHNFGGAFHSCLADVLTSLLDQFSVCPEFPETYQTEKTLDHFFRQEISGFKELLQTVHNDLNNLSQASTAGITLTVKMQNLLEDINKDICPTAWLENTFITCSSLKLWLSELPIRVKYVKDCLTQCPVILSLNMFLRPDRLFWTIRMTHAQIKLVEPTEIKLDFQVMPEGLSPSMPPEEGLFIDGLQLKNASWDTIQSVLTENTLCLHTQHKFPILWIKPSTESLKNHPDSMDVKNDQYLCPLFSVRELHLQSDMNILDIIPLATIESSTLWAQKRVALTLSPVHSQNHVCLNRQGEMVINSQ